MLGAPWRREETGIRVIGLHPVCHRFFVMSPLFCHRFFVRQGRCSPLPSVGASPERYENKFRCHRLEPAQAKRSDSSSRCYRNRIQVESPPARPQVSEYLPRRASGGGERPSCQMITCSARTALDGAQRITDLYCQCLGSPVNQHRRMRS
jgi:hypothetical protein